jgi:hypothetical protein
MTHGTNVVYGKYDKANSELGKYALKRTMWQFNLLAVKVTAKGCWFDSWWISACEQLSSICYLWSRRAYRIKMFVLK